jgi:outer membrane lipopolysaccharide assembly protein LptE/RlpB
MSRRLEREKKMLKPLMTIAAAALLGACGYESEH